MSEDIQAIQQKRFEYLHKLYEATGASENEVVNCFQFGNELGFSHAEVDRITDFLEGEGLISHAGLGGEISITHRGIVEVEAALSKPDEPTTYFPAVNYIHVGQMIASQIQQGTDRSNQTLTYSNDDIAAILRFVSEVRIRLPELQLSDEFSAIMDSDIATIESQASSPRPKLAVIQECLSSIRTILEGIAGNAIATLLLQQIGALPK